MARRLGPVLGASRVGRPRRPMDWWGNNFNAVIVPGTKQVFWLTLPSQLHELADPTLMRTVVDWAAATTANVLVGAVCSLGVIPFTYVSTGNVGSDTVPAVAGVPSPIDDPNADWAFHSSFPFAPSGVAAMQGTTNSQADSSRISKARRRLGNSLALLVVIDAKVNTFNVHTHLRCLIKE